jgi:hypothetical protein
MQADDAGLTIRAIAGAMVTPTAMKAVALRSPGGRTGRLLALGVTRCIARTVVLYVADLGDHTRRTLALGVTRGVRWSLALVLWAVTFGLAAVSGEHPIRGSCGVLTCAVVNTGDVEPGGLI